MELLLIRAADACLFNYATVGSTYSRGLSSENRMIVG